MREYKGYCRVFLHSVRINKYHEPMEIPHSHLPPGYRTQIESI